MIRWALGVFVLLASALPSSANSWNYWNWSTWLPLCSNGAVLAHIEEHAAWAERHTWHRGWVIHGISNVGQTALDPGPSHIDRRYCRGTAWLSNGRKSELVYVIEAGQGFASMGWNVEFCLPAYDPWRVYDSWCRAIQP